MYRVTFFSYYSSRLSKDETFYYFTPHIYSTNVSPSLGHLRWDGGVLVKLHLINKKIKKNGYNSNQDTIEKIANQTSVLVNIIILFS